MIDQAEAEDQEAIHALKSGDLGGLETLVRKYQLHALRAADFITRDRNLAEDIVQAAFLRAYKRIDQFDVSKPFGPWFLRSVVNDAVKTVTRSKRLVSLEAQMDDTDALVDLLLDPKPVPEDLVEIRETGTAVWEALAKLSPSLRAVIILRYFLNLSTDETAERLTAPAATIRWRLQEPRKQLRRLLSSIKPTAG